MMYFMLFFFGGITISVYEGLPLLTCLYEAASAVGTVGLTLGITPELHIISRLILIALMYLGRVGGMTLIYAVFSRKNNNCLLYTSSKRSSQLMSGTGRKLLLCRKRIIQSGKHLIKRACKTRNLIVCIWTVSYTHLRSRHW